jgi:hypothetical protein
MKKFIIAGAALVALAVPSIASADAPNSTFAPKGNAKAHTNAVADGSAKITQNGQWVGGHNSYTDANLDPTNYWWTDQTSDAGSRSDHVQELLASDGHGRNG